MFYHTLKLGNGVVIYVPTSLSPDLYKFIDTSKMVQDAELQKFKLKIKG